jgi:hypothetical protein
LLDTRGWHFPEVRGGKDIAMERNAISSDGTEIAFDIEGSGPPLVLLHGFAANRHCWREKGYVGRLAAAGGQDLNSWMPMTCGDETLKTGSEKIRTIRCRHAIQ